MSLRYVVDQFKRLGAFCRKKRGVEVYECWYGDVRARIDREKIRISATIGELRLEYLHTYPIELEDVEESIERATNADRAWIDYEAYPPITLELEFKLPEKLSDALKTFRTLIEKNLGMNITHFNAEIRFYKEGEPIEFNEWIKEF